MEQYNDIPATSGEIENSNHATDFTTYLESKCMQSICKNCGQLFDVEKLKKLQRGMLCIRCLEDENYQRRLKLRDRRKQLMSDPSRGVVCDVCQRVFLQPSELKKHYNVVHICLRPFPCDVCGKTFARTQELRKHQLYKHTNIRNFPCHLCNRAYKCQNALNRHLKSHTNVKIYECEECGKALKSFKSLLNHKELHARKQFFKCDSCKLSFVSKSALEQHINEKHKGKRVLCDICGSCFSNRKGLQRHKKKCHFNPLKFFECDTCGLKLKSKYTLKLHCLSLHTAKSESFTCEECGKIFGHMIILKRHQMKHAREQKTNSKVTRLSCHLCNFRCRANDDLQQHLLEHSKSLKCGECGKRFRYNFGLVRHFKTAHADL